MRFFYSLLFYLFLPVIFLRLWWRSRHQPDYRQRVGERLGFYPQPLQSCIWVHSVSVGETIAVIPLVKEIKIHYPHLPILMTTMTPTGAARVKNTLGNTVTHAYIPYDVPGAVKRFLDTMHPVIGIIMETELWPNLLRGCQKKNIPVCLINARLSEKSARGYRRIAGLTREMLQSLHVIAAHGEADAKRFLALGAKQAQLVITGNIKFDLALPDHVLSKGEALRHVLGDERFIWVAASTHQGEEEIILNAHQLLRKKNPHALLILVPRHPNRFAEVAQLCKETFVTARRSQNEIADDETAIYLADTMGEMLMMYAAADVAFVGGSLIPRGGHNMLEPAALAKPLLTGPHLFNFEAISQLFEKAAALEIVAGADELSKALMTLSTEPKHRQQMGDAARAVVDENRGALNKQLALVRQVLSAVKGV